MFQVGTKNVYLYLPEDEIGVEQMGGKYEHKLKRWVFPMNKKEDVQKFVEERYPDFFGSDYEYSEDDSEEDSEFVVDHRLHRAKSFSGYESDESERGRSSSSDDDEKKRSRSRSQKFKQGCERYRPKLTNKQFINRRRTIKNKMPTSP